MAAKLLFVVEYATMAHATRAIELARLLDSNYEIHFASKNLPTFLKQELAKFNYHELVTGLNPQDFANTWLKNKFPWPKKRILHQVQEDQDLIKKVKPDVVLGDIRIGLEIACRRENIPFVNLTNAYWSPLGPRPLPYADNMLTNILFPALEDWVVKNLSDFFIKKSIGGVLAAYREMGEPLPESLFDLFTRGDYVMFLDPPFLFSKLSLASNHFFSGVVNYSMKSANSDEIIAKIKSESILIALGSSGRFEAVDKILEQLNPLGRPLVLATSGKAAQAVWLKKYAQLQIFEFLPLKEAMPLMSLAITNGGSPLNYTCIEHAVPNLMVTGNFDQMLSSQTLVQAGLGLTVRTSRIQPGQITEMAKSLLSPEYKMRLRGAKAQLDLCDAKIVVPELLQKIISKK